MAIDKPAGKIDPRMKSSFNDWLITASAIQHLGPEIEEPFPEIEDLPPEPVTCFNELSGHDDPDQLTSPTIP